MDLVLHLDFTPYNIINKVGLWTVDLSKRVMLIQRRIFFNTFVLWNEGI